MNHKLFLTILILSCFFLPVILAETKNPQAIAEHQEERAKREETRVMVQEKKQELRQKLEEIQEKVSEEIKAFREKRTAFADAKKSFKTAQQVTRTCKGKGNAFCQQAREDAFEKKQELVQHAQQEIIAVLTKTKEKITSSRLADENKTVFMTLLQNHIASITNPFESMNESTTQDVAQQVYFIWKDVRRDLKKAQFYAHTAHLGSLFERLRQNEQRLATLLPEKNSTTRETLASVKSKLETVNSIHQHLAEMLATNDLTPEKIKTITGLIKDGQHVLKETHQLMKAVLEELRHKKTTKKTP